MEKNGSIFSISLKQFKTCTSIGIGITGDEKWIIGCKRKCEINFQSHLNKQQSLISIHKKLFFVSAEIIKLLLI